MEINKSFWGVVIKPKMKYEQLVTESFHISKACLEPDSTSGKDSNNALTSVWLVDVDNEDFLLVSLKPGSPNENLDLNFIAGEKICFKTEGTGTVHMTGYLIPEEEPYMEDDFDESDLEDEEEEEVPILVNGQKRKGGQDIAALPKKKVKEETPREKAQAKADLRKYGPKLNGPLNDQEYKAAMKKAEEMQKKMIADSFKNLTKDGRILYGASDDEDEDDDYEDIDDDDEDGEEEEEEEDEMGEEEEESDDDEEEEDEGPKSKKKTPEKKKPEANGQSINKTPGGDAVTPDVKSGKKKNNKGQETPGAGKEKQANGTPGKQQTPAKSANGSPTKGQDSQKKPQKTPKRILKGGVQVEEIKEGAGPEAKRGRTVGMFYDGRLSTNNKRFDSKLEGNPFKFKLGFGEVIKGWDVGIEGIKVGGKRRLTIPAKMAYGDQSQGGIPANSTLVFDVECKFVS